MVLLGTLQGILVAVAISILRLFYQANRPPVYALGRKRGTETFRPLLGEPAGDETFPGLLIVRTEGRMTFASASQVGERLWALIHEAKPRVAIVECRTIPDFGYTALQALMGFEGRLRENGIALWLAALNPEALHVVNRSALAQAPGSERMLFSVNDAVAAYSRGPPPPKGAWRVPAADHAPASCGSQKRYSVSIW